MSINLQNDHLVFDGLEAVTLDGVAVPNAYRLPDVIVEGEASEGAYTRREVEWQLPVGLGAPTPAVGSTVVSGGITFVVLSVRQPVRNDYWGLRTIQLAVAGFEITLYRPVDALDAFGSKVTTYPTAVGAFTDVPAWIILQPSRAKDVAGKKGFVDRFIVYVNEDLGELHHGDLLRDQDGKWYVIESWNQRPNLQALSAIFCSTHPSR